MKAASKHGSLVGNMGLYVVCFELSKRGWNVMPTSRNARGIDIVGYDQGGKKTITVQVKALSRSSPVPFGKDQALCNLIAEVVIIARGVRTSPRYFIATPDEVRPLIHVGKNEKGQTSCWLQPKSYEQFEGRWDKIGEGW
jgi:hypothetical protein